MAAPISWLSQSTLAANMEIDQFHTLSLCAIRYGLGLAINLVKMCKQFMSAAATVVEDIQLVGAVHKQRMMSFTNQVCTCPLAVNVNMLNCYLQCEV